VVSRSPGMVKDRMDQLRRVIKIVIIAEKGFVTIADYVFHLEDGLE
jgi:hypothetical protein